jgi:hypothetical protein
MAERPEIVSGLKNAIDRGYSLDLAVQSFVNAGYNKQDVIDSARVLGGTFLEVPVRPLPQPVQPPRVQPPKVQAPQPQPQANRQIIPQSPTQPPTPIRIQPSRIQVQPSATFSPQSQYPPLSQNTISTPLQVEKKSGGKAFVIILVVVLVLLIGILAVTIFARDWVLNLLGFGS